MADNRLYIGNKYTGESVMVSKSGIGKYHGWYDLEITEAIQRLIDEDRGQFLGNTTDLVFFTEYEEDNWDKDLRIKP